MVQNAGEAEKLPAHSAQKMQLLLQRSVRYSYRERCCRCLPTILCEMLIPILVIILFGLNWFLANKALNEMQEQKQKLMSTDDPSMCPQNFSFPTTSSNDILAKCFRFPSDYISDRYRSYASDEPDPIDLVFQPISNDTITLAQQARQKLSEMGCDHIRVR